MDRKALINCVTCDVFTQNDKLKEFAREVIKVECWSLLEQDGGSLQDLAEKLGLIEKHDEIFKFSSILAEDKDNESA